MAERAELEEPVFYEEDLDFNPLEDFGFHDEDDECMVETILEDGPFGMPNPDAAPQIAGSFVSFANMDTPKERTEALFSQMPTLQLMLYRILEMCLEPLASDELEERVTELKKHHHSVYSPLGFCNLLEQAGALQETDEAGVPLKDVVQEPTMVEIEGVQYWTVTPAPPVFWSATADGKAQLDLYKPLELIRSRYEAEPQYASIFTTILEMCSREGGSSIKQLGDVVDDDPSAQSPRRFAMYFVDKLERAGAVEWKGSWVATQPGREHLASLSPDSTN